MDARIIGMQMDFLSQTSERTELLGPHCDNNHLAYR